MMDLNDVEQIVRDQILTMRMTLGRGPNAWELVDALKGR